MNAIDILGDRCGGGSSSCSPTARPAGGRGAAIQAEFGIPQPALSRHLRILRDDGSATVRAERARRLSAWPACGEGRRFMRESGARRMAAAGADPTIAASTGGPAA